MKERRGGGGGGGGQTDKLSKVSELKMQDEWHEMKYTMRYSKGKKSFYLQASMLRVTVIIFLLCYMCKYVTRRRHSTKSQ